MRGRAEENKLVRKAMRKVVLPWGHDGMLQETPVRVAEFIQSIMPTMGLTDRVDL